jgi:hypothetical protein
VRVLPEADSAQICFSQLLDCGLTMEATKRVMVAGLVKTNHNTDRIHSSGSPSIIDDGDVFPRIILGIAALFGATDVLQHQCVMRAGQISLGIVELQIRQ